MPMFDNTRRQLNDLLGQRAKHLAAAEAAQTAGNAGEFRAAMDQATAMNAQIDDLQAIVDEADRYARAHAPVFDTTSRRDLAEMGRALAAGERVNFEIRDLGLQSLRRNDQTTLATGTLVEPIGAGTDIRSGFTAQVSSLIDQVTAVDLTGLSAIEEPYVVTELQASGGKVKTKAGSARTQSDPTFAKAKIAPWELSVTSLVDRNLSRLNPANYAAKIESMAMRALRREVNGCIVLGDGQSTPDMYGITTAKNTAGNAIYASQEISGIDETTLDTIVYAYGGDEEVGGNARLLLTKENLAAFGKLRDTTKGERIYKITPDAGNPNTGIIDAGGLMVPYTICSKLGATTLAYGDPANYELGLFGQYSIRVDESVKSIERMNAILGDIFVGGNLVIDKGFVVVTIKAASGS